jgi:hypothetical protein
VSEKLNSKTKRSFSELLGNIPFSREASGVRIGEKHFTGAIALIGDGTGLEALQVAKTHPNHAIVILDPNASNFAGKIYSQLESWPKKGINWSFLTENSQLSDDYDILYRALSNRPRDVARIEREYHRSKNAMKKIRQRIFLVDEITDLVSPEPGFFDEIRVTYPEPRGIPAQEFPQLFTFLNKGLREGGTCTVSTDIMTYYEELLKFAYGNVQHHGWVNRTKEITLPLSVYDILNGQRGYYYVELTKTQPFSEMGMTEFIVRDLFYSMALLGLYRMTFGKKRTDKKE